MTDQQPEQLQSGSKLGQWWTNVFLIMSKSPMLQKLLAELSEASQTHNQLGGSAKNEAKSRLKLVLMHDRTQIPAAMLESMRDELLQVISKYVEIDESMLNLCLEQENNTIALVANISVVRTREVLEESPQSSSVDEEGLTNPLLVEEAKTPEPAVS
jgi:cell division topological specificity factor